MQDTWNPDVYERFQEERSRPFYDLADMVLYGHVLLSREAVIEWYRGTLLTTYQQRLDADIYERFVEVYTDKLMKYLDDEHPFFFPYKRILIWGRLNNSKFKI
jgi:trans-aconitate 2-methyltransferase